MNKAFPLIALFCGTLLLSAAEPAAPSTEDDPYTRAKILLAQEDLEGAIPLLKKAIAQGNAEAMVHYVFLQPDLDSSVKLALLHKAAEKENGIALFNLGNYYYRKDPAKAAAFYRRAMNAGHPGAGTRFGLCCLTGHGVKKDKAAAQKAFEKDIAKNDPAAMNYCGVMLMTSGQFEPGIALIRKAAEANYPPALNNLGVLARSSMKEDDLKKSFQYFIRAANSDYIPAVRNLATAYLFGYGTEVNYAIARKFAEHTARKGDAKSMVLLGMMDLYGYGKKSDPAAALQWYLKAAEKGNIAAMLRLVDMYEKGIGTTADPAAAEKWRKQAAGSAPEEDPAALRDHPPATPEEQK